jgi:type VI secretion system protein ImpJ
MFLSPQHFQVFHSWINARISKGEEYGSLGSYGFHRLRIDEEALKRDIFNVLEAEVLFPDGFLASFPSIGRVSERNFAEQFTETALNVYIGIPAAEPNVPQVSSADGRMARYEVELTDEYDENRVNSTQSLEFRRIQARIFFGDEDRTGFESLPIARLERKGRATIQTVQSSGFIPPILACGCSSVLMDILRNVAEVLQRKARDLSTRVPAMDRLTVSDRGAEVSGLMMLLCTNIGLATAQQFSSWKQVHPFEAYKALLQIVGALAIFEKDRVVPELPAYDHRDMGRAFVVIGQTIERLAGVQDAPPFDRVPFEDDKMNPGLIFRGDILPEWIEKGVTYFLGVEMAETPEIARDKVSKSVKLTAPEELERFMAGVMRGIDLEYLHLPPISFPKQPNLHYFRIKTDGAHAEHWQKALRQRQVLLLSTIAPKGTAKFHFFVEYPR